MPLPLILFLRSDVDLAALDAAFASANAKAPAVSAALVKDGKPVWSDGKGATADTVFRLASLTKAFTATIVLQLVNEGKAGLDDPIGKHLPTLPKAWHGVTVRQLLNHTSGIPSYTSLPDFETRMGEKWTPKQIVARTADKPLDFPSGSKFEYNNTGYVILGMLAENLDSRPFASILEKRIFGPLQMSRTKLDTGGAEAESLGFDARGKPALAIHMSQPYAAGSIVSTANDMAKWLAAQGSTRLLPKPLWDQAYRTGVLTDGKPVGYGFGWTFGSLNDVPSVDHGGGIPGFTTFVRRIPSKGLAVVVLTNAEGADPATVANRLLQEADPSLKSSDNAVDDPDPKVTATVEKVLRQFAEGKVDRSVLSAEMQARLTSEIETRMKNLFGEFGAMQDVRLVKVEGTKRTYLVRFEKQSVHVIAASGADGRLTAFGVTPA